MKPASSQERTFEAFQSTAGLLRDFRVRDPCSEGAVKTMPLKPLGNDRFDDLCCRAAGSPL